MSVPEASFAEHGGEVVTVERGEVAGSDLRTPEALAAAGRGTQLGAVFGACWESSRVAIDRHGESI